jgi:GH24 family phage-related lysozyme (muramidase)
MSDTFPLHFTFDNCNEDATLCALVAFSVGNHAKLLHEKPKEVTNNYISHVIQIGAQSIGSSSTLRAIWARNEEPCCCVREGLV